MSSGARAITVLTAMDEAGVGGPAKSLLDSAVRLRTPQDPSTCAPIEIRLVTCSRDRVGASTATPAMPPLALAALAAGIPVDVIRERRRLDPAVIGALRRIALERRPDIVQSHNVKDHFMVRAAGLHRRMPWVAFHEGYTAVDLKDCLYNQLNRWSLRAADVVVTMNRSFADLLARQGVDRTRIRVLHNSIDADWVREAPPDEVAEARRRSGARDGERIVLSVGRLSSEKGHADLLDAFAGLVAGGGPRDVRLVLLGSGPELPRLEQRAGGLGIGSRVTFVGHVADPRPFYAASDLFVLPSHSEGSPMVLLEAMAAALPIVATSVGGVPEMVADGESALLAPARDSAALARAIRAALDAPDVADRLRRRAKDDVERRFTLDRRLRELRGIYQAVTAERQRVNNV